MATRKNTAPSGAPSAASPTSDPLDTSARLLESIAALEVLRALLIAEGDPGSKYITLDGVIRSLYQIDTELGRRPHAEDERPGFDELQARMLKLVMHLRLADQRMHDLQNVPPALQPAAVVLHDGADALERLYNDMDEWNAAQEAPAGEGVQS